MKNKKITSRNTLNILFLAILLINGKDGFSQRTLPNIILIVADDLGKGDLGVYGQQHFNTPHLDQLAHDGMTFTQFYAGTSVCAPSRSALLTGQHTGHTYIRGNKEILPEGQEPLADSVQTFAMLLQKAGYTTGAFGKWGLGMVGTSGDPNKKGFDEFFGYNCQRQSHRYYPTHLWKNDKKVILEGNGLLTKSIYAPELIQEETLKFLNKNAQKPFFMYIATVLPHAELAGPEDEFYKKYENSFIETPFKGDDYGPKASIPGYTSVQKPRATFAAMVERMDHQVGEILQKVKDLGIEDNTIIIFTSDNGPHKEGGADPGFFNSNAGLRGLKRELYEGGINVPFIVKWPGNITPGSQIHQPFAFWDLMPTFVEISHSEKPHYTDGVSIVPTLTKKGKQKHHKYLYWEFHEDGGRQAVRADNWKLVRQQVQRTPKDELYNLKRDPNEQHNLVTKKTKIYNRLLRYSEEAHRESKTFPLLPTK